MCGQGISFSDVIREFRCSKTNAQRILKDCCHRRILFRLERTSPQRFYPSVLKADISKPKQKGTVPIDPTGVNHSSTPLSSDVLNNTDQIIIQTLEGHILPLLPTAPSYIHNIHLKLGIIPQCYVELDLPTIPGNKGKKTTVVIGKSKIDYTFYPNGTVNVEVMSSNHPFRVQTEEDRSRVLGFFGQLQQVLISILSDSHERIVPNVLEWEITEYDINKDVKVSDWFHYTGLKIQVKHMDHLFSLYIKSMGKDTVYRVEERKHPHQSPLDFIKDVFNPYEKVEKLISEFREELRQLVYAIEEKLNSTSTRTRSTTHILRLSNRHQSELLECGVSRSSVSPNTQNLSENSQKSHSYNDDGSDRETYIEVNEREIESRYIEVPNSDSKSDFDYSLVGHGVSIEPLYHWERVVRTDVHGYLMT
jgi:hypothetical protein